jgi:hypothetical protein
MKLKVVKEPSELRGLFPEERVAKIFPISHPS